MAGLVLKMAPKERFLINGAVLENGSRRSRFTVLTPDANILRLRDAVHPDQANTPLGRICYDLQLVLSGDLRGPDAEQTLTANILEVSEILKDADSQSAFGSALSAIQDGKFYLALKSIKKLLPLERDLLALSS